MKPSLDPLPRRDQPRRSYFEPGVVLLVIEHDAPTPDNLNERVQRALADGPTPTIKALFADDWRIEPERTLSFEHLRSESCDRLDLPTHRRPGRKHFSLLRLAVGRRRRKGELLRGLIELNRELLKSEGGLVLDDELRLRSAAPNWLTTPAPNISGGGGPGTIPVPFNPRRATGSQRKGGTEHADPQPTPSFSVKGLSSAAQRKSDYDQLETVEVAILDTVPSTRALDTAAQRWPRHQLLNRLCDPAVLSREYAGGDPRWQLPPTGPDGVQLYGHGYPMADHGLFVAGIVHSIAPQARLRLIEVLNERGVGYVDALAYTLRRLGDERAARPDAPPLVINCSLTIVAPLAGQLTPDPATDDELEQVESIIGGERIAGRNPAELTPDEQALLAELDLLGQALEWIFMAAANWNVLVVAAAGNDGPPARRALAQHEARCPAAFATVVGIGALDEAGNSTAYSNKADRQPLQGLATFGGSEEPLDAASPRPHRAAAGHALLGVYTGSFYNGAGRRRRTNRNGWAWWAGTSFAAPIISGLLAQLVADGSAPHLEAARQQLVALNHGVTSSSADERVIVTQVV